MIRPRLVKRDVRESSRYVSSSSIFKLFSFWVSVAVLTLTIKVSISKHKNKIKNKNKKTVVLALKEAEQWKKRNKEGRYLNGIVGAQVILINGLQPSDIIVGVRY